jgi:hypothetical protein
VLPGHGTRHVTIQTRHGAFACARQRCQGPLKGETTSLEVTEQRCAGAMRARWAACSASDSNRMRDDEVAGLLERVTGQPGLRDQPRQHVVVAKAVEVRRQGQHACQADTAAPLFPVVRSQGDWYAPQSEAGLRLPAAMPVTQPKAPRGQGADTPIVERATKRGHPEVWRLAQPTGGGITLTAGGDATGREVVSGVARVRWQFQPASAGRSAPLPVVAMTDGARTMRGQVAARCGQPVPGILEWDHLDKKGREVMRMG